MLTNVLQKDFLCFDSGSEDQKHTSCWRISSDGERDDVFTSDMNDDKIKLNLILSEFFVSFFGGIFAFILKVTGRKMDWKANKELEGGDGRQRSQLQTQRGDVILLQEPPDTPAGDFSSGRSSVKLHFLYKMNFSYILL